MVAQIKLYNLLHLVLDSIAGATVCIEAERGCVCVCVRACFHVSTRVEFLPHLIFCLVSIWQLYAVNNIEHSHNPSNETQAGFFSFFFWIPRSVICIDFEHNARNI